MRELILGIPLVRRCGAAVHWAPAPGQPVAGAAQVWMQWRLSMPVILLHMGAGSNGASMVD
jgi:hypothetical protein